MANPNEVFWSVREEKKKVTKWFNKELSWLRAGDQGVGLAIRDMTQSLFLKNRRLQVDVATVAPLPSYEASGGALVAAANGALAAQDNVTMVVNELLLVTEESDAQYNGVYELTQVGDGSNPFILERVSGLNTSEELIPGTLVQVERGEVMGGKWFMLGTARPMQINVTPLEFFEVAPVGIGEVYEFSFVTTGAGTNDYEFALPSGIWSMIDSRVHAHDVGTSGDTWQWLVDATALSDAVAVSGLSANDLASITSIDQAENIIESGANVLIGRETDGGGGNCPALRITARMLRLA